MDKLVNSNHQLVKLRREKIIFENKNKETNQQAVNAANQAKNSLLNKLNQRVMASSESNGQIKEVDMRLEESPIKKDTAQSSPDFKANISRDTADDI